MMSPAVPFLAVVLLAMPLAAVAQDTPDTIEQELIRLSIRLETQLKRPPADRSLDELDEIHHRAGELLKRLDALSLPAGFERMRRRNEVVSVYEESRHARERAAPAVVEKQAKQRLEETRQATIRAAGWPQRLTDAALGGEAVIGMTKEQAFLAWPLAEAHQHAR